MTQRRKLIGADQPLTALGQPAFGFAVAMLTIVAFAGALAYGMRCRTKYEGGALRSG